MNSEQRSGLKAIVVSALLLSPLPAFYLRNPLVDEGVQFSMKDLDNANRLARPDAVHHRRIVSPSAHRHEFVVPPREVKTYPI